MHFKNNFMSICDIKLTPGPTECGDLQNPIQKVTLEQAMANPAIRLIDITGNEISRERIAAMIEYAKELRKKFPHMKHGRVQKKVGEYFKVKFV